MGEGRASSVSGRDGRVGRIGQCRKRAAPLVGAESNTYERSGNWKLPGVDMDFSSWTVEALREFQFASKAYSGIPFYYWHAYRWSVGV